MPGMAQRVGAEFVVTRRKQGDLYDQIRDRMIRRTDAPPWPSSAARYCTSDQKTSQCDRWIRNNIAGDVVVALGLRAEESPNRAKKPVVSVRKKASAPTKGRNVYTWLPIQHFTYADVWNTLLPGGPMQLAFHRDHYRTWGEIHPDYYYHPAYVYGNDRVSCALCVLASQNDLKIGAKHNPALYRMLAQMEVESGYTFQRNRSLKDLAEQPEREAYQPLLF